MWKGKVVDGGQGWLYAGVWFRVLVRGRDLEIGASIIACPPGRPPHTP